MGTQAAAGVVAVVLVPIVVLCLLLEVTAGTGLAWESLNTEPTRVGWAAAWFAFALLGPVVVVMATVRSRGREPDLVSRALSIEKAALMAVVPLALVSVFVIIVASVI